MPSRRRILCGFPHLTAPSAVHLTVRFLPAFQHRGLSGRAWPPLSPLQRFGVYEFTIIILHAKLSVNPSEALVLLERNGCCNFQNGFAGRGRPLFIQLAVCYNMDHHFCQGGCDFSDQTSSHSASWPSHCCARCCRQWPWPTRAACMCRPAMVEACICARIPSLRRIMC